MDYVCIYWRRRNRKLFILVRTTASSANPIKLGMHLILKVTYLPVKGNPGNKKPKKVVEEAVERTRRGDQQC